MLLLSARHGQAEVSKLVIDRGADVTAYNCGGDTALHYAASEGLLELVELLIEKGADVNAPNDHGNTPLHYACFWARKEVAQYLVSKGALIAAVNKHGKMPLQRAREALAALLRGTYAAFQGTVTDDSRRARYCRRPVIAGAADEDS